MEILQQMRKTSASWEMTSAIGELVLKIFR